MTRNRKVAIFVVGALMSALAILAVGVGLLSRNLKRSALCTITLPIDNKFGDQHMKTSMALLELYKTRHGRYPDRLSDLDFLGDWDRIALHSVAYHPNAERTRYHLEVTSGWLCSPSLHYPDEFWSGTGYEAAAKPSGD